MLRDYIYEYAFVNLHWRCYYQRSHACSRGLCAHTDIFVFLNERRGSLRCLCECVSPDR